GRRCRPDSAGSAGSRCTLVPAAAHSAEKLSRIRCEAVAVHLNDLLTLAVERGASDLHLKVGSRPVLRIAGQLVPAEQAGLLAQQDLAAASAAIMSETQRQKFEEAHE